MVVIRWDAEIVRRTYKCIKIFKCCHVVFGGVYECRSSTVLKYTSGSLFLSLSLSLYLRAPSYLLAENDLTCISWHSVVEEGVDSENKQGVELFARKF